MKKAVPYIIGVCVLLPLLVLMMAGANRQERRLDERITLRHRDKIPYGTAVASQLLPELFPNADFPHDSRYPRSWDSVENYSANQAVILIADYFDADEEELKRLNSFVSDGNYVFVIAHSFSYDAAKYFHFSVSMDYNYYFDDDDTLQVKLVKPVFASDSVYTYPGKTYESYFSFLDTAKTAILGKNDKGFANFIQMNSGNGSFFIHSSPMAFSNYFLLHKKNVGYYQQALSVIPQNVKTVLWNEYFLDKPRNPMENEEPNWLSTLFTYPAFKWGLLTALMTLVLFVILGMRRKQRMIPHHEKPKNESLDFVKTLGRLYYDRKDHKNLAQKMGAYFLEHVRSKYKIATHTLDDEFVRLLHFKSGYPEPEIKAIAVSIQNLGSFQAITEAQLAKFHKQLELFYQNT